MLGVLRQWTVKWLLREEHERLASLIRANEQALKAADREVDRRVADLIMHMDPFEPLLKKYHGVFAKEYAKPEDDLSERDKILFFQSAAGWYRDPFFKHLIEWHQNVQGNNTLRRAARDEEWFYGRVAVVQFGLLLEEVGRLSGRYDDMVLKKDTQFDEHLTVE